MTEVCRIRGPEYELIRDYYVMPERKPVIRLPVPPKLHPSMMREGDELDRPVTIIDYVFTYYEYDIDTTGVTRLSVYLPRGVKAPRPGMVEGPGVQDPTESP